MIAAKAAKIPPNKNQPVGEKYIQINPTVILERKSPAPSMELIIPFPGPNSTNIQTHNLILNLEEDGKKILLTVFGEALKKLERK
jgi:hypothetical protein